MFAVINRDVMPRCAMAVFVCGVCIFTSHGGGIGHGAERSSAQQINSSHHYASYEDFIPSQRLNNSDSSPIVNTSFRKATPSKSKKITSPSGIKKKRITHITHAVRKGETLTGIARRYGVTISAITIRNNISNVNSLRSGTILKIPAGSASGYSKKKKAAVKKVTGHPRFTWPVHTVVRCRQDGLEGVKPIGIIITGTPGAIVFSSASGIVRKVGHMRGFGQYIVISHIRRYTTVYANLGEIEVKEGEQINAGNPIGRISSGDRELHFQIDHEGKPENPLNYLPKNKKFF